jgi:hypothetical protein
VVFSSPVTMVLFKDEKNAAGDVVASGVEFVHEDKTYCTREPRSDPECRVSILFRIGIHDMTQRRDRRIKTPQVETCVAFRL